MQNMRKTHAITKDRPGGGGGGIEAAAAARPGRWGWPEAADSLAGTAEGWPEAADGWPEQLLTRLITRQERPEEQGALSRRRG